MRIALRILIEDNDDFDEGYVIRLRHNQAIPRVGETIMITENLYHGVVTEILWSLWDKQTLRPYEITVTMDEPWDWTDFQSRLAREKAFQHRSATPIRDLLYRIHRRLRR